MIIGLRTTLAGSRRSGGGGGGGGGAALPAGGTSGNVLTWNGTTWVSSAPPTATQFRGSVANAAALSTIATPQPGDVASTQNDGHLHVYDGTTWTDLGAHTAPHASSAAPLLDDPTAAPGTSADFARADHVHPTPVIQHMAAMPRLTPWSQDKATATAALGTLADGVHVYSDGTLTKAGQNVQVTAGSEDWEWDYATHHGVRVALGRVIVYNSTGGAMPVTVSYMAGQRSQIGGTSTTDPTLTVQSPVGRTGTIQEWQDGAGAVKASVTTGGTASNSPVATLGTLKVSTLADANMNGLVGLTTTNLPAGVSSAVVIGPAAYANAGFGMTVVGSAAHSVDQSVAVGRTASNTQTFSTAVGYNAATTGARATALGAQSTAAGLLGVAVGSLNKADGPRSIAIGNYAEAGAAAENSIVIAAGQGTGSEVKVAAPNTIQMMNPARTCAKFGVGDDRVVLLAELKSIVAAANNWGDFETAITALTP